MAAQEWWASLPTLAVQIPTLRPTFLTTEQRPCGAIRRLVMWFDDRSKDIVLFILSKGLRFPRTTISRHHSLSASGRPFRSRIAHRRHGKSDFGL